MRLLYYDKDTDLLIGSVAIPAQYKKQALRIAELPILDDLMGEYTLTFEQATKIAELVNTPLEADCFYHLEPWDEC